VGADKAIENLAQRQWQVIGILAEHGITRASKASVSARGDQSANPRARGRTRSVPPSKSVMMLVPMITAPSCASLLVMIRSTAIHAGFAAQCFEGRFGLSSRSSCSCPSAVRWRRSDPVLGLKRAAHPENLLGSSLGSVHCAQIPAVKMTPSGSRQPITAALSWSSPHIRHHFGLQSAWFEITSATSGGTFATFRASSPLRTIQHSIICIAVLLNERRRIATIDMAVCEAFAPLMQTGCSSLSPPP
jgi:hypothetical protein